MPPTEPSVDYEALNPRLNKYIPHRPTVKQTAGLLLPHKEILWGGAAGGGKSDWLLMSALQYVDLPGYAAILIRRTFSDLMLPGALIDRAQEWLAPFVERGEVKWHDRTKTFTFPSGSTLSFGYLEALQDLNRYQSSEYSFVGYDELSTFPEERMYTYLFSRLRRSTQSDIPIRMRAASNPGGAGHCVPYGDVLTPRGWRDIRDMEVGDSVYAVDQNGQIVPSIVEQVHSDVSEVIEFDARGFHMAVTPEHKVAKLGGTRFNTEPSLFSLVPFNKLPGQAKILRTVSWLGEPLANVFASRPEGLRKTRCPQPTTLNGAQYARLLGWFLTEGCLVDRDRAISIAQLKSDSRERLRAFLEDDCGFTVSWGERSAVIYAAGWWQHLKEVAGGDCRSKGLPPYVKSATPDVLAAFLDSAMDGDGHWSTETSGSFYSFSKQLADDFAEVAIKLGWFVNCNSRSRPNRDGYEHRVDIKTGKSRGTEILTGNHVYNVNTQTKRSTRSCVRGEQPVYCIGLPEHHAFVIRQRGSVWVSGNSWVKRRFLVDESPDRIFIPARLDDNPYIDQESYRAGLQELDPVTRQQLLNGDWDVTDAGGMFRRAWFGTLEPGDQAGVVNHPEASLVRYWDKASTKPTPRNRDPDYTVGLLMAELNGRFYILDVDRSQEPPGVIRGKMRAKADQDGRAVPIVVEQEPGSSGQYDIDQLQRGELKGFAVYGDRPTGSKQERARPYSAAVYNGNVVIASAPWNTDFLDEHELFPDGPHDDQVDAASGAMRHLTAVPEPAIF